MDLIEMDSYPLLQDDSSVCSSDEMLLYKRPIRKVKDSTTQYKELSDDEKEEKVAIPRHLGLAGCIWYIIGQVIGTGIFISPSGVLRGTGGSVGWALLLWILCAIIQFCGALVYAELSLIMRKSGGDFTFLLQAWGPMVSFSRLWVTTLVNPCSIAIQALVIAKYLLTPFFQCMEEPLLAVRFISICCILFIVYVNCVSIKFSARLTGFLTFTKLFGLMAIFVSGIYNLQQGHTKYLESAFSSGHLDVSLLPVGFFSGLYALSGWDYIHYLNIMLDTLQTIYHFFGFIACLSTSFYGVAQWEIITTITEEIDRPVRNIPLSLFISMATITAVYLMANVAYFTLLSPSQMLASGAVAADYSVLALGNWSWLIWIFVAMSALGSANASVIARSRTVFVAAREGLFPEILSMISLKHSTPLPSIVILLIALVYVVEDDVIVLIEYTMFVDLLFILLTCCILPYYRLKYPDIHRPFKIPLFVVGIYISSVLFLLGIALYSDPVGKLIGLGFALTGLPVYFAFLHPKYKLKCTAAISGKITRFLQRVFFCVRQEKETF